MVWCGVVWCGVVWCLNFVAVERERKESKHDYSKRFTCETFGRSKITLVQLDSYGAFD